MSLAYGLMAAVVLSALGGAPAAADTAADRAALLDGVRRIASPGIPGGLAAFGPDAFVVVVARSGRQTLEPVVAAARLGRGRAVLFGHDGYLDAEALRVGDTARLLANAARWAAGPAGTRAARVGLRGHPGLAGPLRAAGCTVMDLGGARWADALARCDVVCGSPSAWDSAALAAVERFVRRGGGLLAGETGWGWLQTHPGRTPREMPGNRLLAPAGVAWTDAWLEPTEGDQIAVASDPPPLCHALAALTAMTAPGARDAGALRQASRTLARAARVAPEGDRLFLPRLRAFRRERAGLLRDAWSRPGAGADPVTRLLIALRTEEEAAAPVDRVRADPAAASFPGAVPADAPRVTRTLRLDTGVPMWHSTGLYAAPGQRIEVRIPATAAGLGLRAQIGAHTDALWDLDHWDRAPAIVRAFPLRGATTTAASAFGGPLYVVVPRDCRAGTLEVSVTGAVEAPLFVRGVTDPGEWRARIRATPGPWAELAGRRVILTVPSEAVRGLDDPEPLLAFWDSVADACADLAGIPRDRPYPERYVADRQISAGYMHSGYPIMTGLDVTPLVVDVDRLRREGSWGHFHEIGHNHQNGDWTFEGTGEVTVNLFSMYVFETVVGIPFDQGHPAIRDRAKREERARAFRERGAPFAEWKSDPFLALTTYIELIDAFGWDPLKRVIAEYRALPAPQRPRTDDAKRDQWMVRYARAVGRNLGPFFQGWGVPTSTGARASIADLPAWLPDGFGGPAAGTTGAR